MCIRDRFYSEGGIVEFVAMLDTKANRNPLLPTPIYMEGHDTDTNVAVDVAMSYNTSYNEHIFSYVNNINTIEGGTHVAGFRRSITRVFKSYGDKNKLFERAKVEITGDDFREGLSAIISVKAVSYTHLDVYKRQNYKYCFIPKNTINILIMN